MSQVNAQHPEQPVRMGPGELAQGLKEVRHRRVALRRPPRLEAFHKRPTENRNDLQSRIQRILQEDALEFDGVFDGVAIVFRAHDLAAALHKPVHKFLVNLQRSQRGYERLASEAEPLRLAEM